ncbi:hypothetical protein LTR85_003551 [Meristemomyces frigidus]|nr:hypothetical protein LTR85_003551 [Meristemomyces frigidus]
MNVSEVVLRKVLGCCAHHKNDMAQNQDDDRQDQYTARAVRVLAQDRMAELSAPAPAVLRSGDVDHREHVLEKGMTVWSKSIRSIGALYGQNRCGVSRERPSPCDPGSYNQKTLDANLYESRNAICQRVRQRGPNVLNQEHTLDLSAASGLKPKKGEDREEKFDHRGHAQHRATFLWTGALPLREGGGAATRADRDGEEAFTGIDIAALSKKELNGRKLRQAIQLELLAGLAAITST